VSTSAASPQAVHAQTLPTTTIRNLRILHPKYWVSRRSAWCARRPQRRKCHEAQRSSTDEAGSNGRSISGLSTRTFPGLADVGGLSRVGPDRRSSCRRAPGTGRPAIWSRCCPSPASRGAPMAWRAFRKLLEHLDAQLVLVRARLIAPSGDNPGLWGACRRQSPA
jgi:hypothetical protein